ncbi:hypothetical protein [Bradyrhizobium sp.]
MVQMSCARGQTWLLKVSDGATEVAIRLTVQPEKAAKWSAR